MITIFGSSSASRGAGNSNASSSSAKTKIETPRRVSPSMSSCKRARNSWSISCLKLPRKTRLLESSTTLMYIILIEYKRTSLVMNHGSKHGLSWSGTSCSQTLNNKTVTDSSRLGKLHDVPSKKDYRPVPSALSSCNLSSSFSKRPSSSHTKNLALFHS